MLLSGTEMYWTHKVESGKMFTQFNQTIGHKNLSRTRGSDSRCSDGNKDRHRREGGQRDTGTTH